MNSKLYATYYTITRETEKAVLHSEFGWMPKSQIITFNSELGKMMAVPAWLKTKVSRSNYRYGRLCWWQITEAEIYQNAK